MVRKPSNTKEILNELKKRQKSISMRRRRRRRRLQFLSFLMYTKFCAQSFPILKCKSTISKLTTKRYSMCSVLNLNFKQLQGGHLLIQRSFALQACDYEKFLDDTMQAFLSLSFSTKRMKMLIRPDGFLFMVNWVLTFSSLLSCPFQI